MPQNDEDFLAQKTEYSVQELLADAVHMDLPKRPSTFPFFRASMLVTAFASAYVLAAMPMSGPGAVSTVAAVRLPRAGTMADHPPLTPNQARVKRLQELHKAAQEEAASSASSEAASSAPAPVMPSVRADNRQGIYLSATSIKRSEFFQETIDALKAAGGNTIIFDVKGSGVMFHSAAPMPNELKLVRNIYDLPAVIQKLKDNGFYVMGRFVAIKDDALTSALPATKIRHPKSGKVLSETWVDPSNDVAIDFNMQVMCELAAAGIDEVNLDYIRFSTANFGALGVFSGKEKADRVEKFIMAARETINRCGPATKLGLSTYAILGWNYPANVETLGQDVVRFAPLVDIISPMAYPATFTSPEYYIPGKNPGPRNYWLVYRTLTGYAELLGPEHSHKIRPWIQGYSVVAKDVSDQIRAVYDAGFCGFTVWNAGNNYKQSYAAMKADTLKPERCK